MAPIFTPGHLYSVLGWYDATQIATGVVSSWTDMSGNGNHLTQSGGSRPTCTANQQNGNNSILFTAATPNSLVMPSGLYTRVPAGANTIYSVAKRNTESGLNNAILSFGSGADTQAASRCWQVFGSSPSGDVYTGNCSAYGNGIDNTATNVNTVYQIIKTTYDGATTITSTVNNKTPVTNASNGIATVCDRGTVGIMGTVNALDGGIAELLIIGRLTSATESLALFQYFAQKYAITIA